MKQKVRVMVRTAQVFLLEEWYEADKEERKKEEE